MFFSRVLRNSRWIFKGFSLPRPRFLQYITVNLKVFACCSESLRERFRSAQNAPKMPPSGLPDPFGGLWNAFGAPSCPQKVPKRNLKCPKELPSDPQKDYRRPQRVPPELILGLLDANFAALALIFHKIFVNLSFFKRILMILLNWNRFGVNFNMVWAAGRPF